MYIESSAPRVQGDKADLLTPKMTSTDAKCLTFYYHMKGSSIGSLKIFQKVSDSHRGFQAWCHCDINKKKTCKTVVCP